MPEWNKSDFYRKSDHASPRYETHQKVFANTKLSFHRINF